MNLNSRFSLWELAIGAALGCALVELTGADLRVAVLGFGSVAVLAALAGRNWLAAIGTGFAVWVALPIWATVIPGAETVPSVSSVIGEPTTTQITTTTTTTALPVETTGQGVGGGEAVD